VNGTGDGIQFKQRTAMQRLVDRLLIIIAVLVIVFSIALSAVKLAHADEPQIPAASVRYRTALEQAAVQRFGLQAPVARLAAQIQAESGWNPKVASAFAQGLAEFTPATAKWLPEICPDVGTPDPWDAQWSMRALVCYDYYLHKNVSAVDECNRWAFTLSDYNGGQGMRAREQRSAAEHGADPHRWFSGVESYSSRSPEAFRENRGYVREILLKLEPAYLDAGWPGVGACL